MSPTGAPFATAKGVPGRSHSGRPLIMSSLLLGKSGTALEYSSGLNRLTRCIPMAARESLALVLEDTELGRWALRRALEAEGFQVEAVATWAEASACLLKERFSLALVSVSSILENVAGIVADISQDHPDTHLILLADQDSIGELRPMCGPGADILAKPLDLEEVAHVALSRSGPA